MPRTADEFLAEQRAPDFPGVHYVSEVEAQAILKGWEDKEFFRCGCVAGPQAKGHGPEWVILRDPNNPLGVGQG